MDLTVIEPGRIRLKTIGEHHIEVLQMIFSFRVVETPVDFPTAYGRYWCFDTLLAAVAAVNVWDGAPDTEPVGYRKRGGPPTRR